MAEADLDILVVGGGAIGASLMLALDTLGYHTCLVDAQPSLDDARSLALSPASLRILGQLNVWPLLSCVATNIRAVHVSEAGRFGQARLLGKDDQPLGAVVEMRALSRALWSLIDKKKALVPATLIHYDKVRGEATVKTQTGERRLRPRMVVAADGAHSSMRRWCDMPVKTKCYGQEALVTTIDLSRAHEGWAYERFTLNGPMALLPLSDKRVSLVWTLPPAEAARLKVSPAAVFLGELQKAFGYRLGRFVRVGERFSYALRELMMPEQVMGSVVFIGNAAHTLHPVAGQGFNLGLRDVAMLAECFGETGLTSETLLRYQALRRSDQRTIAACTDGLIELFSSSLPGLPCLRTLGLMVFDNAPLLKKILMHYAGGLGGILPGLVCGLPLKTKDLPYA
ncbi:MAG: FAD-dependent monooxygenase [Legionellaceae bacterium]